MNNLLQDIIRLFSNSSIEENLIEENLTETKLSFFCNDLLIPTENDFNKIIAVICKRDSINISIVQDANTWNYVQDANDNFSDFLQRCSTIQQSEKKEIIISITKKNLKQIISIYYTECFYKYLDELPFLGFLLKLNEAFNNHTHITFEVQNETFTEFSSQTIKFIPKDSQYPNFVTRNTNSLYKVKNLCHCNLISLYQFTPEDFYPIQTNNSAFDSIFGRVSLLYSVVFLFDIFQIEGTTIKYRLNGYRTIDQNLNFIDIDIASYETYYQIYNWVYDGGNVVDKIGLARNILSLNFEKENLKISETTFEAIKSGYKIYQKENIKQYIEIRNKISYQLIELQNKADKIVDNFVSDYKKSFLAVASFFISIIVIRVVSSGNFKLGFTTEVTFLSIGFLLIFLLVMFFSKWEIDKQLTRYSDFYKNLKERYKDLLNEDDIEKILNKDKDFDCNKKFIEERRKNYTILWVVSFVILFIITIVLYAINNLDLFFRLIRGVLCCIKNILC